mgnify:CR=1 FL=1
MAMDKKKLAALRRRSAAALEELERATQGGPGDEQQRLQEEPEEELLSPSGKERRKKPREGQSTADKTFAKLKEYGSLSSDKLDSAMAEEHGKDQEKHKGKKITGTTIVNGQVFKDGERVTNKDLKNNITAISRLESKLRGFGGLGQIRHELLKDKPKFNKAWPEASWFKKQVAEIDSLKAEQTKLRGKK